MIAQGDVLLFQTPDGGNITIETNDDVKLTGGFETDFFMSLFGGNQDDDGSVNNKNNWWGNFMENNPAFQFRSRTQNLLISLPLVSGNLRKIKDAVKYDLKSYVELGAITELTAAVSIIGPRKAKIIINVFADGNKISITFLANWQAMEKEFALVPTVSTDPSNKPQSFEYRKLRDENLKYLTDENDDILTVKVKV